tara:strand:+ start:9587 stop:10279 length:693 start_codon:yes stop_codon:yes gene_type:complete
MSEESKETPYLAIKTGDSLVLHALERGTKIPLATLAPEHIVYQKQTITVCGLPYEMTSVAMPNRAIHFIKGEILYNHIAPIDSSGRIYPGIAKISHRRETLPNGNRGPRYWTYDEGENVGEEIDHIDLLVDGIITIQFINGSFNEATMMDQEGRNIELNNISDGVMCTGDLPPTSSPNRILSAIMTNRGNFDHPKRAFEISEHPKKKEKWVAVTPQGRESKHASLWREIK